MVDNQIVFKTSEEIATIVLNSPDKGNTFDWTTIKEMEENLYRVEHDEGIRGLILTASGDKYFCLGADINLMQSVQGKEYAEFLLAGLKLNEMIQRCRKPTIAALNGVAVGAGGEIAMSCDIRIASTNTTIGVPELKIGLVPGWGGVFRLTRLVGQAKAMEMVLTASNISAQEALAIGLVNKVVDPGKLQEESVSMMKKILENAPIGITMAKSIIRGEAEMPFYIGENYEAMASILTFVSGDGKEGMEAFFQKRRPVWSGT